MSVTDIKAAKMLAVHDGVISCGPLEWFSLQAIMEWSLEFWSRMDPHIKVK